MWRDPATKTLFSGLPYTDEVGMNVSAVVCVHRIDRLEATQAAVHSLLGQTHRPKEVIVVADRSSGLRLALQERLPADVRIMENRWDQGLSHARNTGISAATGDLVIFLDDDAVAAPDWLARLVAQFDDPWVAAAGGRAVPEWLGSGARPWWLPVELDWAVGCTFKGFGNGRRYVRNVLGSNMCFRRDVLDRAGGFDARVGGSVSGDDTEACLRILAADDRYRIVYDPEAVVRHKVPSERQTIRYILSRSWNEGAGKAIIQRLHPSHGQALASETSYLRDLAQRFLVVKLGGLLTGKWDRGVHILTTLLSVSVVGCGFVATRLGDVAGGSRRAAHR
jgi:GT2 family glycosyltransferase